MTPTREEIHQLFTDLTVENSQNILGRFGSYKEIFALIVQAQKAGALHKFTTGFESISTGFGDYFKIKLITGRTVKVTKVLTEGKDFTIVFTS
jgi:hypothetical protein